MRRLLVFVLLLASCVTESQMDACQKACAPQGVEQVSWFECICQRGR